MCTSLTADLLFPNFQAGQVPSSRTVQGASEVRLNGPLDWFAPSFRRAKILSFRLKFPLMALYPQHVFFSFETSFRAIFLSRQSSELSPSPKFPSGFVIKVSYSFAALSSTLCFSTPLWAGTLLFLVPETLFTPLSRGHREATFSMSL